METKILPDVDYINSRFSYDENTGILSWKNVVDITKAGIHVMPEKKLVKCLVQNTLLTL